ncbi:MAG: PEP-CTERM sorting domain-containing protein [Planctomycetota bacterium]
MIHRSTVLLAAAGLTALAGGHSANAAPFFTADFNADAVGTLAGVNAPIGTTGLRTRNAMNAEIVVPDVAFTTATGNALQLATNAVQPPNGFAALSPDLDPGIDGDQPIPAPTLNDGDIVRISFDMLVQTPPASASGIGLQLRADNVNSAINPMTDFTGANAGDLIQIVADFVVGTDLPATTASFNTFFQFEGAASNYAPDVSIGQIDNIVFEVIPIPEPGSLALLSLGALTVISRTRRRA